VEAVEQRLRRPVGAHVRVVDRCDHGEHQRAAELERGVAKSTASHHLKTLSRAGVIAEREEGTRKHLQLRRAELDRRFPGLIDSVLRAARAG